MNSKNEVSQSVFPYLDLPKRKNKTPGSKLRFPQIPGLEILFSPLSLLRAGGIPFVVYVLLFGTLGFYFIREVLELVNSQFYLLASTKRFRPALIEYLRIFSIASVFALIGLPSAIAVATVPVASLKGGERLDLAAMILDTPNAVIRSLRSLTLSLQVVFYYLIPVLGLSIGYYFLLTGKRAIEIPAVFHVTAGITLFLIIGRLMPVLFAPFVALLGDFDGLSSIALARIAVKARRRPLLIISFVALTVFLVGVVLLTVLKLYFIELRVPDSFLVAIAMGLVWYYLTALAFVLRRETELLLELM